MKKRRIVVFVAIALMLMGTAASAAAIHFGVLDLFTVDGVTNESAANVVQAVDASYEGESVRFTVNSALYDEAGKSYALGFTIENLKDADNLYVVCDHILFGGKPAFPRSTTNFGEYVLPTGITEGAVLGELPEDAEGVCEIGYTILRGLYPFAELPETDDDIAAADKIRSEGLIPIDSDGWTYPTLYPDMTYAQGMLATGQFEIADTFTLRFELDKQPLDSTKKMYSGQAVYTFDDYEVRIDNAYTTATAAHFDVAYITAEKPKDGGKGFGPLWEMEFTTPDHSPWTGNAGGSWDDPVQMDDGRYMTVYHFEALQLFSQPDTLIMTLITYDENLTPTKHEDEAITLHFGN